MFTTGDLNGDGIADQEDVDIITSSMWFNFYGGGGGGGSLLSMVTIDEKSGLITGIKPQYLSAFATIFPELQLQLVPEPGTLALLTAASGVLVRRRRF